jgi:predicted amidohydrolase/GNAT superfamily N-acetyltransferase
MKGSNSKNNLVVRQAQIKDIEDIKQLTATVYQGMPPYSSDMLRGQINNFPEGHYVAALNEKIVGYCAAIRLKGELALAQHTWKEATGSGFGVTHNAKGDYLYGYEVAVDPNFRGLKIGARFYAERKKLCRYMRLKGIVFGGRLPNLAKKIKDVKTPEAYVKLVQERRIQDPVLYFQLRNGFKVIGILKEYLPLDHESLGYSCHLLWENPEYEIKQGIDQKTVGSVDKVRISVVQYEQRRIASVDEFREIVTYFIDVVSDYKSDFVLFPELFTAQLLSIENERISPSQSIDKLCDYTDTLKDMFHSLALKFNINIIAGSHPVKQDNGDILNTAMIFLRGGEVHYQAKIHPTPNEKFWWNIKGGDNLSVINTDCGPIGVLICYDCEFPELGRYLANQGANMIFVPFLTDERHSYNRVRYCAQARAIENQCYVAMAGSIGNLPRVQNMDIHYAQSCIISPCDFNFARDGIVADTTPNVETISVADLRIQDLYEARSMGTVQNLRDRRHDLYQVVWHKAK